MTAAVAFVAGATTVPAAFIAAGAVSAATQRTAYECTACRWSTGWRAALPAWLRWRWHRHITRPLGRCRSVRR